MYYDIVSSYANQPPSKEVVKVPKAPGLSARLGIQLSGQIGKNMMLNIAPFTDVKLVFNSNGEGPNYNDGIPDNRFSFGLKMGIEYLF